MTTPDIAIGATVAATAPSRSRAPSDATEAAVNALSARIHVGGKSSAASLRSRSLSSVDSLDDDAAPAEISATVNLSTRPSGSEKISLSNTLRGHTRVRTMSPEAASAMQDLYQAVKASCIRKGIVKADVKGFTVGIDQGTVKYLDNEGNQVQKSILADREGDPDFASEVEELTSFADKHMPYNTAMRPSVSSKSKGNTLGPAPLKREPTIQGKWYPKTIAESTKPALALLAQKHLDHTDHLAALTRMGLAETFYEPFRAKIIALRTEAQAKLEQARTDKKPAAEIVPLQKEVDTLNGLAARIREMDPYAAAVALSFSPTQDTSSEAVYQRAEEARDAVEGQYRHDHKTYKESQEKPVPVDYNEDYAKDVGGLLFATQPEAHAEYHHYCAESNLVMKAESFDDVFFRVIMQFAKDSTVDVNKALAPYFEGLSAATKDAIDRELDTATTKAKEVADKAKTVPMAEFEAASTDARITQFRTHVGLSAIPAGAPWDAKLWQETDHPLSRYGTVKRGVKKAGNVLMGAATSTIGAVTAAPGAFMGTAKATAQKAAGFFSRKPATSA